MSTSTRRYVTWARHAVRIVVIMIALAAGYVVGTRLPRRSPQDPTAAHPEHETASARMWTCSMHPDIRRPKPGVCPICAMDLVPVPDDEGGSERPRALSLSPAARELAGIQVAPVERRLVTREVHMVGKVDYDETRVETITAWVPGRLDRLFVDYTGIPVRKGDHMVYLYSPEILTAQQELLQAHKAVKELQGSDVAIVRETAEGMVAAAREKLRLWGLNAEQVREIEQRGTTSDHITIYAPSGGIVVQKDAVEGMYVQTGTRIYTIADLSQVWVKLDAYESDLAWLRYAQQVEFRAEAYPGETFTGRISFIHPVLDRTTRTVKVRVTVANSSGRLKPGMFVRASVRARLGGGGKVVDADLAGKWISPMHPDVIKDEPGPCDVCGMPLVKAETLGFVGTDGGTVEPPLVIPASAPLITGRRAVVYVREPADPGRFEGRVVTLGPRAGDWYVVTQGLRAGELVVVNGSFKIDSALQIMAKQSMMSPPSAPGEPGGHGDDASADDATTPLAYQVPEALTRHLNMLLDGYDDIQTALVKDDAESAATSARDMVSRLDTFDGSGFEADVHSAWTRVARELDIGAGRLADASGVEPARQAFALLSEAMASAVRLFGSGLERPVYELHCPMAFGDRGANWLQSSQEVSNPYFGDAMLRCGDVTGRLAPAAEGHVPGGASDE